MDRRDYDKVRKDSRTFEDFSRDVVMKHLESDTFSLEEINLLELTIEKMDDGLAGKVAISMVFKHRDYSEPVIQETNPFE